MPLPQQPDRTPLEESDLRHRLMRFLLPEDDTMAGLSLTLIRSLTVDVGPCVSGLDVLRKVLEEFCLREAEGESSNNNRGTVTLTKMGGLIVDGWGIFLELEGEEGLGEPLSEAEVLAVCYAPPNHPIRKLGLTLRRVLAVESGGEGGSSELNCEPVLGSTLHPPSTS
jgi:mitogen-activated protein kinase kinase kinase